VTMLRGSAFILLSGTEIKKIVAPSLVS